jgi:hypothetical protein
MSYCDHCEGQRFDRARVLRTLRQVRKDLWKGNCQNVEEAMEAALRAVKALDIPHLEWEDEMEEEVVH